MDLAVGEIMTRKLNIPQVQSDLPISSVISRTSGSHEPVFVYEGNTYLGSVWPYKLLFVDRPALQDKTGTRAVKTTYITPEDGVMRAMEEMISQRLYTLPVFESQKMVGVIRTKDILRKLIKDKLLTNKMWDHLEVPKLFIAEGGDVVRDIYSQMRKKNISRAVVVGENGQLEGIVSRRDIYLALMAPPKGKQRYSDREGRYQAVAYDEDWITKLDYPLRHLVRTQVVKALDSVSKRRILSRLLADRVRSVVIVDDNNRPQGILSTRPFLKAYWRADKEEEVLVEITDRKQALGVFRHQEAYDLLSAAFQKWRDRYNIERIVAVWDTARNASGRPKLYTLDLQIVGNGELFRSQSENHSIRDAIRIGLEKLRKQLRRKYA